MFSPEKSWIKFIHIENSVFMYPSYIIHDGSYDTVMLSVNNTNLVAHLKNILISHTDIHMAEESRTMVNKCHAHTHTHNHTYIYCCNGNIHIDILLSIYIYFKRSLCKLLLWYFRQWFSNFKSAYYGEKTPYFFIRIIVDDYNDSWYTTGREVLAAHLHKNHQYQSYISEMFPEKFINFQFKKI